MTAPVAEGLPAGFPVRVLMLSDWIVGTGEGRVGYADATVRRDADGLPFVPAKTLTGIWRDACEQAALWLGGPWQEWVDWIFGSQPDRTDDLTARAGLGPRRAALSLGPARMPRAVRVACRDRPALREAAVLLRPGVAVDDETGVARDDMLRLEERARPASLEAHAEVAVVSGEDLPKPAELLLRAGAAAIERLGGKRNRGAGRCWVLLPGMPDQPGWPVPVTARPKDERLAALTADVALLDDPGRPPRRQDPGVSLAAPARPAEHRTDGDLAGNLPVEDRASLVAGGGERVVHRVTLEVITPLVAQDRVLGNVVLSRDFVPGTILMPVILSRLDGQVGHRDVVVGDARPAIRDGDAIVPGRPAPMTWHRPKERHCADVANAWHDRPDPEQRRKAMRAGHVAPAGDNAWHLLSPAMAVSAHAVISDDEGRPTEDGGGVFTYLGIEPGTLLVSDIVLPAARRLAIRAGDMLRLGRSRKDEFGRVRVTDVRVVPLPDRAATAAGDLIAVWCVSDVLLLDPWGAPDPSPGTLARALAARLGVPLELADQVQGGPAVHAHRSARRESFHTRWGRPRPSLVGMAAGSVVTVRAGAAIPGDVLAAVERDGVGERTAEGFGQVRFDAREVTVRTPRLMPAAFAGGVAAGEAAAGGAAEPATGGGLPPAPDVLELAAVESEARRRAAALVLEGIDRVVPGASAVTSRAQWGSLRDQVARLRTPGGREAVTRWFDRTAEVQQRRAVWGEPAPAGPGDRDEGRRAGRATREQQTTLGKLRLLLTEESEIWNTLGLGGPDLDRFLLAPERGDAVRAALWLTAVSVLIGEISREATRELQQPEGARR